METQWNTFFPLPDKLVELIKLFDVDNTGNLELLKYINDVPIDGLKWCLNECKSGYSKDDWWIEKTIEQIKEHSSRAVLNFFVGFEYYKVNNLNEEL